MTLDSRALQGIELPRKSPTLDMPDCTATLCIHIRCK